jgi:hypothetical protein
MPRLCSVFAILLSPVFAVNAAEPIPNVTAKATSAQVDKLFGATNLCNDNGLADSDKKDGSRKLTTNVYAGGGCMWHSGYIALGGDENPIVEFDLGKLYDVGKFHVWNHNANPHRGFRHVSVMISANAKDWKPVAQQFVFAKAPKSEDYVGESYEFTPPIRARYIRFHCDSTHRQGGNRELAGLGKVRFYEAAKNPNAGEPVAVGGGVFPDGAGVVNVKLAPYSGKGDGKTDDTAAIQKAIDDWQGTGRTILLPPGTYIVSQPLRYTPGKGHGYNNFRGAGTDKTTIQLRDNTFTDPAKPLPVLTLGFNGKPDGKGVHADWFNNNVGFFTISTGTGNTGAIGLQYYSNNAGALRDVAIVSKSGTGSVGLDLGYADQNGPCLVKNIRIDGFATGVRTGATVNSQTAEHITITKFTNAGWENSGQCLAIRGLKASGTGTGFVSKFGVVALIDSEFTGTGEAAKLPAITSGETLFARNITTSGYKLAIENKRKNDSPTANADGAKVEEWVSTAPLTLYPIEKPRSLNLAIQETPDVEWDDPAKWANIRSFRDLADADDSAALQRAIDSGATTIYLPCGGSFYFGKPVEIRGSVKRIVGMFANVNGVKGHAVWKIGTEGPQVVVLQDCKGHLTIEHSAKRTLVVKNGQGMGGTLTGGGDVFLENVVADWDFSKGRAWARQFNNEREGTHITNAGATLWILGLKTERGGTLIETKSGGTTEVLGGLSYTTTKGKLAPMFVSTDARVSYVMGEVCYTGDPFARLVEQKRGSESKILDRKGVPLRPAFLQGSQIPLFVGHP